MARNPGERDDVADVLHAGHELHDPLEAEAEARVGRAAVAPEVQIPPVVGGIQACVPNPLGQSPEAMLALVLMDHALRHRGQNQDVESSTPVIPATHG